MPHFAPPSPPRTSLLPRPGAFLGFGLAAAAVFAVMFVATQYYRHRVAPQRVQAAMAAPDWPTDASAAAAARQHIQDPRGVVRLFDLDAEANLPTAWSSFQLLGVAGLLAVNGVHARRAGQRFGATWLLLAGGFALLAIDEAAQLHGGMYVAASGEVDRRARGVFYYSWVIPALAIVGVAGAMFARFLWNLPPRTRWMFVGCGVAYVGSAVGGEMLAGWLKSAGVTRQRLLATAAILCEEVGEMVAITAFASAVLTHMRHSGVALLAGDETAPQPTRAADDAAAPIPFPRPGRQAA